ncbi:hypothetical protein E1265_20620 [Streptomyces sp. 8K308]|nr:hypothetical protein E1265_20620 [Streptomyces sp. 8K308]
MAHLLRVLRAVGRRRCRGRLTRPAPPPGAHRLRKDPQAVAVVIDSQSVKAAEAVSAANRGYDAGRRVNDHKRRLMVDTRGLLLPVMVTPVDTTDRDAARAVSGRRPESVCAKAVGGMWLVSVVRSKRLGTNSNAPPQRWLRRGTAPSLVLHGCGRPRGWAQAAWK